MTPKAYEDILRILDRQPPNDPVRLEIERIVVRARLAIADTDPALMTYRQELKSRRPA